MKLERKSNENGISSKSGDFAQRGYHTLKRKPMKKMIIILFVSLFASCSDDDSNDQNNLESLVGNWNVTAMNKENGENLLIQCTNGELPSYTFTNNNELNTQLYIGSASTVGPCQSEIVFYNYEYNPTSKIITITNASPNSSNSEYKTEIIEMTDNRFKTRYISGNVQLQTTVTNFTTVFERQ